MTLADRATILDYAALIIRQFQEPITTSKLQKLCYFVYAWSLVHADRPAFDDTFVAWSNGPLSLALRAAHPGRFEVSEDAVGDAHKVDAAGHALVSTVVLSYDGLSGHQLSELSERGGPWALARDMWEKQPDGSPAITIHPDVIRAQFIGLWNSREIRFPLPR